MGFFRRGGASLKRSEMTETLSRSNLRAEVRHARVCEWCAVYASIMSTL